MAADRAIDGRRIRGSATRAKAIEAASTLFAAQGYSATSIGSIAAAAGVHSASLYHAFGSKEGLLAAVVEHAAEDFFGHLESLAEGSTPWESIRRLAGVFESRPLFLQLLLILVLERGNGDPTLLQAAADARAKGRELIRDVLRQQLPHVPDVEAPRLFDDVSRLVMALLDGGFIARQVDADHEDFTRLIDLIAQAVHALLAPYLSAP